MVAVCGRLIELEEGFSSKISMTHFLQIIGIFVFLAPFVQAQEILMIDKGGRFASLDPKTGQVSILGSTGIHGLLWDGLAMNSQGRIFTAYGDWNARYGIYELDRNTGQATFVVGTSLKGIRALSFDSSDVLYALDARDAPLIDTPLDLHTIDLATGATTFIGDTLDSGSDGAGKLTFADGILWAHNVDVGLVQIDVNTGISTDVNPLVPALPFTFPDAICSSSDDTLYYVGFHLYLIDRETGAVSQVAPISIFASWSGAVFNENSGKPFSLWYSGTTNGPMEIKTAGGSPNGAVALIWATGSGGPTTIPNGVPCAGLSLGLNSNMRLLQVISSGNDGRAILGPRFVPASASFTIRVQAVDLTICETSNVAIVGH